MKTNQDFKNEALAALKGNWPSAVVSTLIFMIIASAIAGTSVGSEIYPWLFGGYTVLSIFLFMPVAFGYMISFRKLVAEGDTDLLGNQFRLGFGRNYWKVVGMMLLMSIYITLWSLLLVVPGIIKAYSYAMAPFILADEPELSPDQAIHKSRMMMRGHKFDYFWLQLSFIGWWLLAALTAFIGLLWLTPYCNASYAAFYAEVKAEYEAKLSSIA